MKGDKSYAGWYFLAVVIFLYLVAWLFSSGSVQGAINFSLRIFGSIIPVFVLVFGLMAGTNYFVKPQDVAKHLGKESGLKRWFFAVFGGILSTGPIYMWYPMLRDLRDKGVNYGFVATFLYNRAVKPPLLPIIIFYFGLDFTIVLTFVMILFSLIQGFIFEKIEEVIS